MDAAPADPYVLPTIFHRDTIFVEPVTTAGHRLHFYTDTGGADWMYQSAAAEIGVTGEATADELATGRLPDLQETAWIPTPLAGRRIRLNPSGERGGLFPPVGRSGLLGQQWFADRIWEIDYAAQRLVLHQTSPASSGSSIPLGFPEVDGRRGSNFPRIEASVDGERLDLLLDTGAHTRFSSEAITINRGSDVGATSFIINSIADRWHAHHPDWRVITGGEAATGAGMIEVPNVRIGNLDTGPVWFTRRGDSNFTTYMSQWMDRTVVGALGGNALRVFHLVLDYRAARASLQTRTDGLSMHRTVDPEG